MYERGRQVRGIEKEKHERRDRGEVTGKKRHARRVRGKGIGKERHARRDRGSTGKA